YYWEELVAPEGYQLDRTKREFSITYKDQETKVIETQSTSKENVIKFSLDGFKYVDSKSGDTKTGYNGIDFTLTPIDPTKGEQRKVTTETDENGYDGYWAFNEVPYGDYKMSEVKAPEGYKTIKDLIINSKFDAEKREYTFTITEDGQKE
ncbi:peptidase, partial [Enterococcus hirae]